MMQRYDLCGKHTTAKLMLMYEDEDGGQQKTLQSYVYGEIVRQIAGVEDVSAEEGCKVLILDYNQRQHY